MLEFYRTRAGRQFFDFDLKRLIEAMEGLSTAINESNKLQEKKMILEKKKELNEKAERESNTENN